MTDPYAPESETIDLMQADELGRLLTEAGDGEQGFLNLQNHGSTP